MKNKNLVIAGLAVVILVIICLIIFLVVKGNDDKKKSDKKTDNNKSTKYEIKDQVYDRLTISNITVEPLEKETIVNFTLKNNSDEAYPEGMMVFSVESGNVPAEEISTYISTIDAKSSTDVEIIINGVYEKIDSIKIKELDNLVG